MAPAGDAWDPTQYEKFHQQRAQPFYDLLALVRPRAAMRAIDLGCGTGELSAELADRLSAEVDAIDSSPAMIGKAKPHPRRAARIADIATVEEYGSYQLVFSNAALHWVPDHEQLMARIFGTLRAGAQVAVQMPANGAHPSHRIAVEVARAPRFSTLLGGFVSRSHTLPLERYAELLFAHGFREPVCFEKIYGHPLPHAADVVEWTRGTLLLPYLSRLDEAAARAFLDDYRARLVAELGDASPYFYPFRRLLFWGEKS